MVCQQIPDEGGENFDLYKLFCDLLRFGNRQLRLRGCFKSNECSEDVATRYLFDLDLRGKGRGQIQGAKIRLNYPGAKNQKSVLYKLFNYELLNKHSTCNDCRLKKFCPIREAFATETDDRSGTAQVLIDPSTPANLLESKELLDICLNAILKAINKPERRKAFWLFYQGLSHADIAVLLNVRPETVRQWHKRDLERVRQRVTAVLGRSLPNNSTPPSTDHERTNSNKSRGADLIFNVLSNLNPKKIQH